MILDIRTRVYREKVFELAQRSQRPDVQSSIFISVRAGSWLCVEWRDPRVRAEPPMKIIISVKWTSLGQEETVGGADQEWLHRISFEQYVNLVCQRMRIH